METAGGLSARLFVDIQQAQQALQNINTLLKVSQKNFQELGKQGLYLANGEFKKFAVEGVAPVTKATEQLTEKTKNATQEYRQFFREQRLQDRMLREGKEAIMGVAFAFMMLTSSGNETSSTMKGVQKGLVGFIAGMNATEFSMFSLGRSLSNMGGAMGNFGLMLMKNSSIIGAVVGIGAGLIAFFSEANAEAKKAAEEGLKQFNEQLQSYVDKVTEIQELSRKDQEAQKKDLESRRDMLELRIQILKRWREQIEGGKPITIVDWEKEKAGLVGFTSFKLSELDAKSKEAAEDLAKTQSSINAIGVISTAKKLKTEKEITDEVKKQREEKEKERLEAQKYEMLWVNGMPPEHRDVKGERAEALKAQDEAEEKLLKDEEDRLKIEEEIAKIQRDNMDSIINSVGNLRGLFGDAGDKFIQKLQTALQIVQTIQAIQARTAAEKAAGGVLTDIADFLSIGTLFAGLFDTGGYTGAGSRYQPAGIVHRGEIVFEKPIVDKYGSQLMALRSSMQGYAGGGKVENINTDSFAMISNNSLLNEVRALRQQNALLNETMKRVGDNPIVIQANLDAIKFLKKYKPEYDKFEKKKLV
jgi:ABC-type multidrug transport system fused ATPase/permease subunit